MEGLDQPTTAEEINRLHRDLEALAMQSVNHAIRIGELLSKVKTQLPHGKWIPWLNSNVKFSERTARNYMRVFENREKLKSANVADLAEAYQLLTWRNTGSMTKEEAERVHKALMSTINEMVDLMFKQFELQRMHPDLSKAFPETAAVFEQLSQSRTDNEFRYHLFCHILRVAGRADLADLLPVPL
jgi:hypothetical protein